MDDIFEDAVNELGGKSIPGFTVPEGFYKITKNNITDIYLVQTVYIRDQYKFSAIYDCDDFTDADETRDVVVLSDKDKIQPLGKIKDFLKSEAPLWDNILTVYNMIPKEYGLLPALRAIDELKKSETVPSFVQIESIVKKYITDYHNRRAVTLI